MMYFKKRFLKITRNYTEKSTEFCPFFTFFNGRGKGAVGPSRGRGVRPHGPPSRSTHVVWCEWLCKMIQMHNAYTEEHSDNRSFIWWILYGCSASRMALNWMLWLYIGLYKVEDIILDGVSHFDNHARASRPAFMDDNARSHWTRAAQFTICSRIQYYKQYNMACNESWSHVWKIFRDVGHRVNERSLSCVDCSIIGDLARDLINFFSIIVVIYKKNYLLYLIYNSIRYLWKDIPLAR